MKINRVNSETIRDDRHRVLLTPFARMNNISCGQISSTARVDKVPRQAHHSSFRIQDHHSLKKKGRPSTVIHVTIRSPTNNINSTKENPVNLEDTSFPMPKILTARDRQDKSSRVATRQKKKVAGTVHTQPILSSFATTLDNSDKSIVSQSFVKPSHSEIDIVNAAKMNRHSLSSVQPTSSWSNGTDLRDLYEQKSNRNKKRRYFNRICGLCLCSYLCLSLLGLFVVLGIVVVAVVVPLMVISKTTTTTTIIETTETTITTTTKTTATTTTETTKTTTTTTTKTTTTTTTTTTTPCNPFPTQTTYSTGSSPYSVIAADVNGDGYPDIIVANFGANSTGVLLNIGNGTFVAQVTYSTGSQPSSVAAADVNGDGKLDIIVANQGTHNVGILLNTGNGTFAAQVSYSTVSYPRSVAAADVNADGKLDIIVANSGTNNVGVLLNTGNGTFIAQVTYPTGNSPFSVAAADVNGDSYLDIIVANYGPNNVGVLKNRGNGTFATQVTYSASSFPYSVATGDVDGDGNLDIIVANEGANTVSVLRNTGNGTFVAQVTYSTGSSSQPSSVAAGDVNGDSKLDIIVANLSTHKVGVLLNAGNGTFIAQVTYSTGSSSQPNSVAVADVNGDGRLDIIVANPNANNVGIFLSNCY